jgi:hypothetical protein
MSQNDWGITKLIKTIIMLKNILKLKGAQKLSKNEQKSIKGGNVLCPSSYPLGCFSAEYYCPNPDGLPICVKKKDLQ